MKTNSSEGRARFWFRVLRPLSWWLLLMLVLFAIHTHQRWMEQTRIQFSVTLQDTSAFDATVLFDGQPALNNMNISLGNHTFTVRHPKAEAFTTNFFAWYGPHDFGNIKLQRTTGTINLQATSPAATITVTGPEFSTTLYNCNATNLTVPTDAYTVLAKYPHWSQSQDLSVFVQQTAACKFSPPFGTVVVSCNKADATGQMMPPDGQSVEVAQFPYTAADWPEGIYKFTARHNGDLISQAVRLVAGNTNTLDLNFSYGSLTLESDPSGASVRTSDGQYWGETPLKLAELKPGQFTLNLQRSGYELATVSLAITADQVTALQANLVAIKPAAIVSSPEPVVNNPSTFNRPASENVVVVPTAFAPVAPAVRRPVAEPVVKPREMAVPYSATMAPAKLNVTEPVVNPVGSPATPSTRPETNIVNQVADSTPAEPKPATETVTQPKAAEVTPAKRNLSSNPNTAGTTVGQDSDTTAAQAAQRKAVALRSLQRAKLLASQSDYLGAIKALNYTLKVLPDNEEAKALLAEYQQQLQPNQVRSKPPVSITPTSSDKPKKPDKKKSQTQSQSN